MKPGRVERQKNIEKIKGYFEDVRSIVVSDYRGLNVAQMQELRTELAKLDSEMHVQKNRFTKRALQEMGYPETLINSMQGPNALIYVKGEEASTVLKSLFAFAKQHPIEVKGSFVDQGYLNAAESETLSRLPTKAVLLAMLVSSLQAPLQEYVSCLHELIARFMRMLMELAEKKGK